MTDLSNTHPTCRPVSARRVSLIDLLALYRQRRALAALDCAALDDLGLSRDQALAESRRSFWDFPANRRS